jgi:predicted nucleic-acid-binding Zn-ribbon protein
MVSPPLPYTCSKCHSTDYEYDEIRATGRLSRFFDVQNKKFLAVACQSCGYTELYRDTSSQWGNLFDWFLGS